MPPERIDEKTVLDAAAEVFAREGYSGARIEAIAARAGVNKAMLYYRIGDKRELYRRVVLRGQEGFREALEEAMETSGNAPETLERLLHRISGLAFADSLLPSIILREMAGGGGTLPEEAREGIRGFMKSVRSIVAMGTEEGSFRTIDPVALQFAVIGAVFTLSLTSTLRTELSPAHPGPVTPHEAAAALMDLLSHGILAGGGRP